MHVTVAYETHTQFIFIYEPSLLFHFDLKCRLLRVTFGEGIILSHKYKTICMDFPYMMQKYAILMKLLITIYACSMLSINEFVWPFDLFEIHLFSIRTMLWVCAMIYSKWFSRIHLKGKLLLCNLQENICRFSDVH